MFNMDHIPEARKDNKIKIIGLVGRYGCGKSTYASMHESMGLYRRAHFKGPIVEALKPFNVITEGPQKDRDAMRSLTFWASKVLGQDIFSRVAHAEWEETMKFPVMYDDVRRLPEANYILEQGGILLGFGPPITEDEIDAYEIPEFSQHVEWTHNSDGTKKKLS